MTARPRQASLLRGINVGGRVMVPMARLREIYAEIGATDVTTLLQSGNVVFRHELPPEKVSPLVEAAIRKALDLKVAVIGRTHEDLRRIAAVKEFADAPPNRRFVVFLSATPKQGSEGGLVAATSDGETICLIGAELHMHLRDGVGRSRLQLPVIERKLGVVGTTRNWNTVTKLAVLTAAPD